MVGVGEHHFDVVALEMDERIEGCGAFLAGHSILDKIEQTVARAVFFAVEEDLQPDVEIGVVVDHHLDCLGTELEVAEEDGVGGEFHNRSVGFGGVERFGVLDQVALVKLHRHHLSVADAADGAFGRHGVDRLKADAVETHRFLEAL